MRSFSTGCCWAFAIAAIATINCAGCECGRDEYLVRSLFFDDSASRVQGQSLYPEALEEQSPGRIDDDDPRWVEYHQFFSEPSEFVGELYLGTGVYLFPPWCEDTVGSDDDRCAWVGMDRLFAGPKREGEVYSVIQMDDDAYVPGVPAIYLSWDEEPYYVGLCDFPEYHSTSAIGTATVLSEHPITITFDVEFRDEADQVRHVTTTFAYTGYEQVCHPYD